MKLLFAITLALTLIAGNQPSFAEAKKSKEAPAPAEPAKEKAAVSDKAIPMHVKVDSIDAANKTFTRTNKDGKVVKLVVTSSTVIKNGAADAKFEDIKEGDTISGLRVKKNAEGTEYEIVKITKFGVAEKKAKNTKAE